MRGIHFSIFAWAIIFLIVIFTLIVSVNGIPSTGWWEQLFGNEARYELPVEEEVNYGISLPTDSMIRANKMLSYDHYSVSEVACDITKDIYTDLTSWGENRSSLEYYFEGQGCFIQPMGGVLCEYSPIIKDYICLIGSGKFNLTQTTLTQADRNNLTKAGCCLVNDSSCGCTYNAGNEYKLDEVCVNEIFSNLKYKGESFCTEAPSYYHFIGDQRLKFGNNVCYWNSNNVDNSEESLVWKDSCGDFCMSSGTTKEKDNDRIHIWRADNESEILIPQISDNFLSSEGQDVSDNGKSYLYTIYWNDSSKRYEIQFPRIVSPAYPGIQRSFDRAGFLGFISSFFDSEDDARKTSAGVLLPELRTIFDGLITLTDDISKTEILNRLLTSNVEVNLKDCPTDKNNCLDYFINTTIWQEELDIYQGGSYVPLDSNWIFENENPIYVRTSIPEATITAGKYRVIIRNWHNEICYEKSERQECGAVNQKWCKNQNVRQAGKKIWCENKNTCPTGADEQPSDCIRTSARVGSRQVCSKFDVKKYADKSLIIIKIPVCSDTDAIAPFLDGINYNTVGVATFGLTTASDMCADATTLYERYCPDPLGEIGTINYNCPYGCSSGRCNSCTPGTSIICHTNYPDGSFDAACSARHWASSTCSSNQICKEGSCELVDADVTSYTLPGGTFARSDTISIPYTIRNVGGIAWTFLTESRIVRPVGVRFANKWDTLNSGAELSNAITYNIGCGDPLGTWWSNIYVYTDASAQGGWNVYPASPSRSFTVVQCINNNDCQICVGPASSCIAGSCT